MKVIVLLAQAEPEGSALGGLLIVIAVLALLVFLVFWLVQRFTKGRCPHCRQAVKVKATRCQHCHADIVR